MADLRHTAQSEIQYTVVRYKEKGEKKKVHKILDFCECYASEEVV